MKTRLHLLSLLDAVALTACSENGRALVPVNVSLASDLDAGSIASLEILASSGEHPLERRNAVFESDGTGVSRFAIYLDTESEIGVVVSVRALAASGVEVGSGRSAEVRAIPGGTSAAADVVLSASGGQPGDDGGTNPDVRISGNDTMPMQVTDAGVKDSMAIPDAPGSVINPDPKWAAAVNQEDDGSASSILPRVAVAPNGDAVVVWTERNRVKSKKYTAATGVWGNVVPIDNRVYPQDAVIGMDGTGRAVVVWTLIPIDTPDADRGLWASTSMDGVNWTAPQSLWKGASWGGLDIAVSKAGKARVVWEAASKDANNANVSTLWTAFFGGTTWSSPAVVKPSTVDEEHTPSVAINAQEQGIIAFSQGGVFAESIWTARFSGASVSTPVLMENSDERAFSPTVAMNGDGRGVLLWTSSSGSSGLIARVFNGDAFLGETPITMGTSDGIPSAVVDKFGNVTVAWASTAGSFWNVNSTRLTLGGVWSEPVPLETVNRAKLRTDTDPEPCVGLDGAGNVMAIWRRDESSTDDYTFSVWGARLPFGGKWTEATKVHSLPMLRVLPVSCGMSDNGVGVAAFNYTEDDALNAVEPPTFNVFTAIFR